jgi:hypothetical protein
MRLRECLLSFVGGATPLLAALGLAERILLLTFTRRAAREMIERARTLAERVAPDAGRIVGGTFHSVAHRMVRVHATSLGLDAGFGVLDAGDAGDLLDLVRQEHGGAESPRRFPRAATMLDIYSRPVNAQTPLSEILAEFFPWCDEHHQALAEVHAPLLPVELLHGHTKQRHKRHPAACRLPRLAQTGQGIKRRAWSRPRIGTTRGARSGVLEPMDPTPFPRPPAAFERGVSGSAFERLAGRTFVFAVPDVQLRFEARDLFVRACEDRIGAVERFAPPGEARDEGLSIRE